MGIYAELNKDMRIILTGSTGLIGAEVLNALEEKHHVYTLGKQLDLVDQQMDLTTIDKEFDYSLPDSDCFVHCAGVIDEDFIQNNPLLGFQKSIVGLEALLKKSISSGARKFIYLSSTHVYGMQNGLIEERQAPNPLSNYALAHYCAEQLFRRYAASVNAQLIILRPNAVYGIPKYLGSFQRWSLIPFSFPKEAKKNGRIVLKSSGNQKRNFVSIKSIAKIIHRFVDGDLKQYQGVINVLGAHTESVYEFALRCKSVAKESFQIECEVERPQDFETRPYRDMGSDFQLVSTVSQDENSMELNNYLKEILKII